MINETNFQLSGVDNSRRVDKRPRTIADCEKTSKFESGTKPKPASKKFQKVKYEIDRQNFTIAQLTREIETKTKREFPLPCLYALNGQLCNEKKKLEAMIKHSMSLQQSNGGVDHWDAIPLTTYEDCKGKTPKPPRTPSNISKISAFTDLEFCESLLSDNENINNDRFELQEELYRKDQSLHDLEDKVDILQCQLIKMCNNSKISIAPSNTNDITKSKMQSVIAKTEKLTTGIHQLESNLSELRVELDFVKNEKKIAFEIQEKCQETTPCNEVKTRDSQCPKTSDCNGDSHMEKKLKNLQCQYTNLQAELCRKEKECKETTDRMKKCLAECNDDKERAENEALKHRADELVTEITDYKVFIKELQEHVDMYREKFMKAQEKVEHQRYLLENLEMSNQDVESQINSELANIKAKFQEKLSELCPYPKKYEEARVELEESKIKIVDLENDLKSIMAALCKAKCELKTLKEQPNDSLEKKYKQLQCEVEILKKKSCSMKATKICLEEKLAAMKAELDELRKDSAKIITTTKCCAEKNRQILHQHINSLEVDLAQCRASAAMSLTEKEETIKKMKTELTGICSHFNDCQGQIKQLKNQVAYLTNQRHKTQNDGMHQSDNCYQNF